MKKKTNNLNSVLESIVNQYFGDFPLDVTEEKSKKEQKPILEKQEAPKKQIDTEPTEKKEEIDPNTFLESLREDFFTMLNTTKKIEEKKELSNELEEIAKTFFN